MNVLNNFFFIDDMSVCKTYIVSITSLSLDELVLSISKN